jgi:hypothetical protein
MYSTELSVPCGNSSRAISATCSIVSALRAGARAPPCSRSTTATDCGFEDAEKLLLQRAVIACGAPPRRLGKLLRDVLDR